MRNIDRPPPGDPMTTRKSQLHPDLSKKRSAYFESEFAATNRDPDPVKARVQNEAIVMADLRTNVIVSYYIQYAFMIAYLIWCYRSRTSSLL